MKTIKYYSIDSFKSLSNTYNLTICSMLISLCIVSSFLSFYLTQAIKISFSFLFIALIAMKFGPLIAGISAAIADVVQYIVKPVGPYQPLLTLSAVVVGIIFGLFLYRNKSNLWRIIISRTVIVAFISILADTYFIALLYGYVFSALFISRLIQKTILLPIEILMLIVIISAFKKIENSLRKH